MSTPSDRQQPLVGCAVQGRHGILGIVDDVATDRHGRRELLVIGGRSSLLRFHVPTGRICDNPAGVRTVAVDADVADFAPRAGSDGSIELYLVV